MKERMSEPSSTLTNTISIVLNVFFFFICVAPLYGGYKLTYCLILSHLDPHLFAFAIPMYQSEGLRNPGVKIYQLRSGESSGIEKHDANLWPLRLLDELLAGQVSAIDMHCGGVNQRGRCVAVGQRREELCVGDNCLS